MVIDPKVEALFHACARLVQIRDRLPMDFQRHFENSYQEAEEALKAFEKDTNP